jgi:ornithine cyclodeaminase/alanine dehydrogenase-like protein (mu-crystallin family)
VNWDKIVEVIRESVEMLSKNDYSQPMKLYLRYGAAKNRIIAMPSYVGGIIPWAGIKWISNFPDNIYEGSMILVVWSFLN